MGPTKIKLPYKPNKMCCLTSCPICGRYFSVHEVVPDKSYFEKFCLKRSCSDCDDNPMLRCGGGCIHVHFSHRKNVKFRINNYWNTRQKRLLGHKEEPRRISDDEKTSIIYELLNGYLSK